MCLEAITSDRSIFQIAAAPRLPETSRTLRCSGNRVEQPRSRRVDHYTERLLKPSNVKPEAARAALSHVGFMIQCYVTQSERKRVEFLSDCWGWGGPAQRAGLQPEHEERYSSEGKSVSASAEQLEATFLPAREKQFKT